MQESHRPSRPLSHQAGPDAASDHPRPVDQITAQGVRSERQIARILTLTAALLLIVLGLLPTAWQRDWTSVAKLAVVGAIALWIANSRFETLKLLGVTIVVVFIANHVLSPFIFTHLRDRMLLTLPPHFDWHFRVVGDVMPGFEGVQHVTTDGKGFRTTPRVDYHRKPAGTSRVFAIGASTTEELYLDDRKTWTHLLQGGLATAMGTRVEVVNTGVSGLRSPHHLVTLNHISRYQPDLVLILMGVNDWNHQILEVMDESRRGLGSWWKAMNYHDTALAFVWRKSREAAGRASTPPASASARAAVDDFAGDRYSKQNDSLNRPQRAFPGEIKVSPDYVATTQQLVADCRQLKLRCIFLTQPTAYDAAIEPALKQRLWMTPPNATFTLSLTEVAQFARVYNQALLEVVRSQGGEACDVASILPPTTQYFFDDCHYNENGARAMARAIQACIVAAPKSAN